MGLHYTVTLAVSRYRLYDNNLQMLLQQHAPEFLACSLGGACTFFFYILHRVPVP